MGAACTRPTCRPRHAKPSAGRRSRPRTRDNRGEENAGGPAMATAITYGTLSPDEHSAQLRRAVIASTIGTTIEWYDFFIYGTVAALIFGKLYFPNTDPYTGTL